MAEAAADNRAVVVLAPRPSKGVASWVLDLLERLAVCLGHDKTQPLYWLSGNFAPVRDETPPVAGLPVRGHLPVSIPYNFPLLHNEIQSIFCNLFRT